MRFVLVFVFCALLLACGSEASKTVTPEKPNFVFVVADDLDFRTLDQQAASFSNIARLENEGTSFERFFATTAVCCPSRASMWTGKYAHNHNVWTISAPDGGAHAFRPSEGETLPVWLQRAGYKTGLVGKYMNEYESDHRPPGWGFWRAREIGPPNLTYSEVEGFGPDGLNAEGKLHTDVFAGEASYFVRSRAGDPFFLWAAPYAPHEPAHYPERHAGRFADAIAPRPPNYDEDTSDKPDFIPGELTNYQKKRLDEVHRDRLRSMMAVDDMVGRLLSTLEETGELGNTYFFFTSDNGWLAGNHRIYKGKTWPYEESVRVPLVVRGPGVPSGKVHKLVSNTDLAPTVASLSGASTSGVDGSSLSPFLRGETPEGWRKALLLEADFPEKAEPYRAVRTGRHLYVEYDSGPKELYDVVEDPGELTNIGDTAPPETVSMLKTRLEGLKSCSGDGCKTAEGFR